MKMKILRATLSLILSAILFVGYMAIEKYMLTWIYSSLYVGITAATLYVVALAAFFLSGKRAAKMVEWPMLSIITSLLLAIITKIAK